MIMDFELTARQAYFRNRVSAFIEAEIKPRLADGPDGVHARAIARAEFGKHAEFGKDRASSGGLGVTR